MNLKHNNPIIKTFVNSDGVFHLILNNPKNHNALSEEMMFNIQSALNDFSQDDNSRVMIISSKGSTFSAGHDLKELKKNRKGSDNGKKYFKKILSQCSKMMLSIVNSPKPIIAEVNGVATAAGCQLVSSCDLVYASPIAKFATPGVNIGLFCSTPMVALSRSISIKHSMEMLLNGELMPSKKAMEFGLVNKIINTKHLRSYTLKIARKISKKSAITLKIGKQAFYKQLEMSLPQAYNYASRVMLENMLKLDAKEGINAFLEKRRPRWKDK